MEALRKTVEGFLSESRDLSNTIRDVLRSCPVDWGFEAVTVLSVLYSAAVGKEGTAVTARSFARDQFAQGFVQPEIVERISRPPSVAQSERFMSPGLIQAFEEARAIRARTGGQDGFIGLRHVIFAILTGIDPPLSSDADDLLALLSIPRGALRREAAVYVLERLEPEEKEEVWRTVFAERGIVLGVGEGVAISQPDDPWAPDIQDRSGARREAKAFAEMILASTFEPPLAVGVFGDWGSGKSFFMRLVYEQVRGLKGAGAGPRTGDEPKIEFLTRVAQIRFNAWHYAETNLWASLVTHIFADLDRSADDGTPDAAQVLERLSSARRLTVAAAEDLIARRTDLDAAKTQDEDAQKAVIEAQEEAGRSATNVLRAAWEATVKSPVMRARLDQATQILGLDSVTGQAAGLHRAVQGLDEEVLRRSVWRGVFHTVTQPAFLVLFVGCALLAAIAFNRLGALAQSPVTEALATIGGLVGSLAAGLGWAADKARKAAAGLRVFRAEFEKTLEKETEEEREKASAASAKLAAAETEAAAAADRLETAKARVDEVSRDYQARTGDDRVLRFVRGRIASGEYAGQLGFVATVRKDFEELSLLMRPRSKAEKAAGAQALETHREEIRALIERGRDKLEADEVARLEASAAAADEAHGLDRIILYIDDLDRCAPEKVIDVLQAVHLLLAFPLFVVFVAVDVRWLRHALEKHYSGQIVAPGGTATATAGDYLEKIFQIPYWVRPLAGARTVSLLGDYLKRDREEPEEGDRDDDSKDLADQGGGKSEGQQSSDTRSRDPGDGGKQDDEESTGSRLRIKKAEAEFIGVVGQHLDGSPRRTLRFINAYRLIKASLESNGVAKLEAGGYRQLATLLTISVAADTVFPLIAAELKMGDLDLDWLDRVVDASPAPAHERALAKAAFNALGPVADVEELRDYAALVERFSFHPSLTELPPAPVAASAPTPEGKDARGPPTGQHGSQAG